MLNGRAPVLQARAAGKFQVLAYKVTLKTPTGEQVRPRHSALPTSHPGAAAAGVGAAMRACARCGHEMARTTSRFFTPLPLVPWPAGDRVR